MNIGIQRNLAIKILKNKSKLFNLYTAYNKDIEDNKDFVDICSFLETYLSKHRNNYFEINLTTGDFKFNNQLINSVISYLLSLKPYQFEKVSTLIGKCFNYNETYATKKSRDQGIDFICSSEFLKDLNSFDIGLKHYIIGQAKKFKRGLVDTNDIKNLYASIDMFTKRLFPSKNKYNIYSNIELKKFTPIHPVFSTSYFFSNDALNICQQADIITIDIIDLTFILTKGIDNLILDWKKGAISIDRKKANKQLRKIKIIK